MTRSAPSAGSPPTREVIITAGTSSLTDLPPDALPQRVAVIALLLPVGLMATLAVLGRAGAPSGPIPLTDTGLLAGLAVELVLATTLGVWLWRAGWRPHRSATRPFAGLDLARGLGLWAIAIAIVGSWALVCRIAFPTLFIIATQTQMMGSPHFWVALPFSVFNAVFEELLWLGLAFTALRRLGVAWAGAISIALRVLVHAYQGPLALVTVLPVGIIFTGYYIRTRRMWPVVVAHAFQDTLALGLLGMSRPGGA